MRLMYSELKSNVESGDESTVFSFQGVSFVVTVFLLIVRMNEIFKNFFSYHRFLINNFKNENNFF